MILSLKFLELPVFCESLYCKKTDYASKQVIIDYQIVSEFLTKLDTSINVNYINTIYSKE